MTVEEAFDKWWDDSGKLALVADLPPKTIAFHAFRSASLAKVEVKSAGYQWGFHSGQGGTEWKDVTYWNGQRNYTSREVFTLLLSPTEFTRKED